EEYGIGTFGNAAYEFVDFLKASNQHYWQILPLGPTGFGDSPYQAFSTFAGNPYFIDLNMLCEDNLLDKSYIDSFSWYTQPDKVNYPLLYENRFKVLHTAYENFKKSPAQGFKVFCQEESCWLDDYSIYMSLNMLTKTSWHSLPAPLSHRDASALLKYSCENQDEIQFWKFLQFEFFTQWYALKSYANKNGVKIMGDLPIYVSDDSSDVWANPDLFQLDEDLMPSLIAGVPPDAFSCDGQMWGNPVYRWEQHKLTNYDWWTRRLACASKMFDVVRIDHFRGFDSFYAIPMGDKDARNGHWLQGPGIDFFSHIKEALGEVSIIAEDLGVITPDVKKLVKDSGYPGMKVLEFAFEANPYENDGEYLPHSIPYNSIVYLGTHDNLTALQWWKSNSQANKAFCLDYMAQDNDDNFVDKFIRLAFATCSKLCIITMQDWLNLDGDARMNTPSTTEGNWQWRCDKGYFTPELSRKIRHITEIYRR
ncbi:MAG: 4-alpha-glucanotransferase, partial [Oscillospiraceae bacterium]